MQTHIILSPASGEGKSLVALYRFETQSVNALKVAVVVGEEGSHMLQRRGGNEEVDIADKLTSST